MRVTNFDVANIRGTEEFQKSVAVALREVADLVNGRLTFEDNSSTSLVTVTFAGASTTVSVPHTLNRPPIGYIVAKKSAAIHVYDGDKANTSDTLYVQASAGGVVRLIVF